MICSLTADTDVELIAAFGELSELWDVAGGLSLWRDFAVSGGVGGLFIYDVEVEIELVGVDGVCGDDVIQVFPVIQENFIRSI